MSIKGCRAILTGAGGGIGRVIAVALAKEGVKTVLFGGNNKEKLEKTAKLVKENGGECVIISGNLTDDKFLSVGFKKAVSELGGLDILINNAGMAYNCDFDKTAIEVYDKIMNINARVPFYLSQLAISELLKSNHATIINIASVVAHQGYPYQSAYSASKHALLGFTKSLAQEVFEKGVRVHAISPGGVYTDMIKISRPDLTSDGMIMPEDIANTVMFLLNNRTNAVIDEIILHRSGKTPFLV